MLIADSYLDYFYFCVLKTYHPELVIQALKHCYETRGIPETAGSDAGNRLISKEFRRLAKY